MLLDQWLIGISVATGILYHLHGVAAVTDDCRIGHESEFGISSG